MVGLSQDWSSPLTAQLGFKLPVELFHLRREIGCRHADEPLVAVDDLPELFFTGRRSWLGELEPRVHDFTSPLSKIIDHLILIAALFASMWTRSQLGYSGTKKPSFRPASKSSIGAFAALLLPLVAKRTA
jgi:hypothetical protein